MSRLRTIETILHGFLRQEVQKTGLSNVVVGLSGGIDSAVVAVLAHAVFKERLLCVMMPSQFSSSSSIDDAKALCESFKMRYEVKAITPMLQSYLDDADETIDKLRVGNLSARLRMCTLYDYSARESALVIGTSNKSELLLGYGTLFGDLASALNPIGDIYKSEIFEFARYLGVTEAIINKPPSADLFEGQSDESDLGYSYAQIDAVLKRYVEQRATVKELYDEGFTKELVDMIVKKIYANQFKRKMPLIAKLSARTINSDFNYARDVML